jgi:DNA-binding transcriptional ArsR family regulator
VIEFELSIDALGRSRFAYSPLAELASSLRALWSPHIGFVLQPWRHAIQSRLKSADLALLRAICPPGRFAPDFMFVWSIDPKITIDAQLNDLAQLPADQLRANLAEVWTDEALPDHVADLLEGDPSGAGRRIADELWSYWSVAVAPYWPRISAVIEGDVSYRASQILRGGLYDLLSDLHPEVSLHGSRLLIDKPHHKHGVYTNGELTLVPSVFVWPNLIVGHDRPGHFELHYAARGVGNVWNTEESEAAGDALGALLGRTRATILARLGIPLTTTQLARELGQSPATISGHLSVLRRSGLLSTRRSGRMVLYRRTALGSSVVSAAAVQEESG